MEPDINRQGSHSIARMQRVHERVVAAVYDALARNDVWVEGTVLKVSMVTAGKQCPQGATAGEVRLHSDLCGDVSQCISWRKLL